MSMVTRRSSLALVILSAVAILGFLFSVAPEKYATSATVANGQLERLELNPLGTLGAPSRLRSIKMADPSQVASLPTEAMVYRVVPKTVSLASVEAEARRFGVEGEARKDNALTLVQSASGDVVVDNVTGSVNWITPSYETATLPMRRRLADDEYASLAKAFMEARGLWENEYVLTDVGQYTVEGEPVMVEVSFGRTLNGKQWQGVGPKKTVVFGDDGEIVGFFSVWREVEPLKRYPLVPPSEALEQIEAGDALVSSDELDVDALAERVELVYINDGAGIQQRYVAPYYKVTGRTSGGKPFTAVTRAIPLEFVNERPDELPSNGGTAPSVGRIE